MASIQRKAEVFAASVIGAGLVIGGLGFVVQRKLSHEAPQPLIFGSVSANGPAGFGSSEGSAGSGVGPGTPGVGLSEPALAPVSSTTSTSANLPSSTSTTAPEFWSVGSTIVDETPTSVLEAIVSTTVANSTIPTSSTTQLGPTTSSGVEAGSSTTMANSLTTSTLIPAPSSTVTPSSSTTSPLSPQSSTSTTTPRTSTTSMSTTAPTTRPLPPDADPNHKCWAPKPPATSLVPTTTPLRPATSKDRLTVQGTIVGGKTVELGTFKIGSVKADEFTIVVMDPRGEPYLTFDGPGSSPIQVGEYLGARHAFMPCLHTYPGIIRHVSPCYDLVGEFRVTALETAGNVVTVFGATFRLQCGEVENSGSVFWGTD